MGVASPQPPGLYSMKTDFLIVGAGFSGAVLAERLASQRGKQVVVLDSRSHIGGNAYDHYDAHGIQVHRYGPHIFHTTLQDVIDYLHPFTQWRPYVHKVLSQIQGQLLPFPINRTTINRLYNTRFSSDEEVRSYIDSVKTPLSEVRNAEEKILSSAGSHLYELFFKEYTSKQWGLDPKQICASVTARIPLRFNEDDRYFTDPHQGVPKEGYTALFQRLLDHPNITVVLGESYKRFHTKISFDHLIYTGSIDEYFDYCYGPLPYRSMQFAFVNHPLPEFQSAATINYPDRRPYTRVTEFKKITGQQAPSTTLCYEFPRAAQSPADRFYPIPNRTNEALYRKYAEKAKKLSSVTFCGRLGDYKYYNMDHAIYRALSLYRNKLSLI